MAKQGKLGGRGERDDLDGHQGHRQDHEHHGGRDGKDHDHGGHGHGDHSHGRHGGILAGIKIYEVDLKALNDSGVDAKAILVIDQAAKILVVQLKAEGLEPNAPGQTHLQHIHGLANDANSTMPPKGTDPDGDGYLEVGEGASFRGPVQLNLSLEPEVAVHDFPAGGHSHAAEETFPSVGADGKEDYLERFVFDPADPNSAAVFDLILPLDAKVMVIHRMSIPAGPGAGTAGEVDGTAGYKAGLPVAAGEIHDVMDRDDIRDALREIARHDHEDDHHDGQHAHHGDLHLQPRRPKGGTPAAPHRPRCRPLPPGAAAATAPAPAPAR